jgi:hypothetical protein
MHRRFFVPKHERRRTMSENINNRPCARTEKKIGNTTYIVNTSFNGNENFDLAEAVYRLIIKDRLSPTV